MSNIFNDDFKDFITCLNNHEVDYILVGGYAVILHGYHRTTGDLDVWINPTQENYIKMTKTFLEFGLPTNAIDEESFLDCSSKDVFTFGRPPVSIDILTQVKGLDFLEAFQKSKIYETDNIKIRLISYNHLISAKRAVSRYRDLNDIKMLEEE